MSPNTPQLALVSDRSDDDRTDAEVATGEEIRAAIDNILCRFALNEKGFSAHKALLELYRQATAELLGLGGGVHALQQRAALIAAQSKVLDVAASLPAEDIIGCAYKLALWRHDYVRSDDEIWPRGDIVAATVLEDLIAMTGETSARFDPDRDEECV